MAARKLKTAGQASAPQPVLLAPANPLNRLIGNLKLALKIARATRGTALPEKGNRSNATGDALTRSQTNNTRPCTKSAGFASLSPMI